MDNKSGEGQWPTVVMAKSDQCACVVKSHGLEWIDGRSTIRPTDQINGQTNKRMASASALAQKMKTHKWNEMKFVSKTHCVPIIWSFEMMKWILFFYGLVWFLLRGEAIGKPLVKGMWCAVLWHCHVKIETKTKPKTKNEKERYSFGLNSIQFLSLQLNWPLSFQFFSKIMCTQPKAAHILRISL